MVPVGTRLMLLFRVLYELRDSNYRLTYCKLGQFFSDVAVYCSEAVVICLSFYVLLGPFHGAIAVPCHALSLSSLWTSMRRRRVTVQWRHLVNWHEAASCGELAQHFSNASCF